MAQEENRNMWYALDVQMYCLQIIVILDVICPVTHLFVQFN